jgi:hypothetical protein
MTKGNIYMIKPICEHDESDIYIGSTTKPLYQRFQQHIKTYHTPKGCYYSSHELFKKYGVDKCEIILIEEVDGDKIKLREREGHHIKNTKCINKVQVGRTLQEYHKECGEINKERLKMRKQKTKEDEMYALYLHAKQNEPRMKELFLK